LAPTEVCEISEISELSRHFPPETISFTKLKYAITGLFASLPSRTPLCGFHDGETHRGLCPAPVTGNRGGRMLHGQVVKTANRQEDALSIPLLFSKYLLALRAARGDATAKRR
jgi:hypothetical protein